MSDNEAQHDGLRPWPMSDNEAPRVVWLSEDDDNGDRWWTTRDLYAGAALALIIDDATRERWETTMGAWGNREITAEDAANILSSELRALLEARP